MTTASAYDRVGRVRLEIDLHDAFSAAYGCNLAVAFREALIAVLEESNTREGIHAAAQVAAAAALSQLQSADMDTWEPVSGCIGNILITMRADPVARDQLEVLTGRRSA